MATTPPLSPLLRLPVELHLEVISHLLGADINKASDDEFSALRLRLVNHYFHSLIPAPDLAALHRLGCSDFAIRNSLMPCNLCARLRRKRCFDYCVMWPYDSRRLNQGGSWPRLCTFSPAIMPFCYDCGSANRNNGQGYSSNDRLYMNRLFLFLTTVTKAVSARGRVSLPNISTGSIRSVCRWRWWILSLRVMRGLVSNRAFREY